jgi:ferredoxin
MFVDRNRCVACFNCIDKCRFDAMKYAPAKISRAARASSAAPAARSREEAPLRRQMLLAFAGLFAVRRSVRAQQLLQVDGGLAGIEDKKTPARNTPLVPPGAQGLKNLRAHCTACQLCVSACPNNILRPSGRRAAFMQPEMSFEQGYCRPECTECSHVCPAGAITPVTAADKTGIAVGYAVWKEALCIVNADEMRCTICERHCPTGAITLIARDAEQKNPLKIPAVDRERCIGCGACEYLCPARPFSAIYVEGNVRHHSV